MEVNSGYAAVFLAHSALGALEVVFFLLFSFGLVRIGVGSRTALPRCSGLASAPAGLRHPAGPGAAAARAPEAAALPRGHASLAAGGAGLCGLSFPKPDRLPFA